MKKQITAIILLVALIFVAVKLFQAKTTNAAGQDEFGVCVSQVPQSWGQFKGGSEQSGLAFEDGQGTLRFITNIPCNGTVPTVALEVRRIPRN